MQISVTLKQEARAQAIAALKLRGVEVSDDWFGPVFENASVIYDHFNPDLFFGVAVHESGDPEYFYPYSDIARIKIV